MPAETGELDRMERGDRCRQPIAAGIAGGIVKVQPFEHEVRRPTGDPQVDLPGHYFVAMADPEGNEFCASAR